MPEVLFSESGQGQELQILDTVLWAKATSTNTGGAFSLWEGIWQPGGFRPLPHLHREQDESFFVLDGQFDFQVGNEMRRATKGTFVFVPRGVLHGFEAAGDSPARLMFLHAPSTLR